MEMGVSFNIKPLSDGSSELDAALLGKKPSLIKDGKIELAIQISELSELHNTLVNKFIPYFGKENYEELYKFLVKLTEDQLSLLERIESSGQLVLDI